MNKHFLLAAIAALALGFQAHAQLNVLPSGATRIGTPEATDTTAATQIAAIDNMNAIISFGNVTIATGTNYSVEHTGTVSLMPGFKVEKGATFSVKPSDY